MKTSDRTLLLAIAAIAAIAAVWFLLIAPKRDEASSLSAEVDKARTAVEAAQQEVAEAQAAKSHYAEDYHRLVVLGKAAPSDDDTASLFVQLNAIAGAAGADLEGIKLSEDTGAAEPATAAQATTSDQSQDAAAADAAMPAAMPATEASAALLPLGATVGPAGLPVMPYELTLKGNYFQIADFIDGLQKLVGSKQGRQVVNGRLVTIDGFTFQGNEDDGFPELDATLNVTTYVAPADQGLTAGASPTGPAPVTSTDSSAVPASDASTTTTDSSAIPASSTSTSTTP
jgi:Tfp pilus assembly protein PilO